MAFLLLKKGIKRLFITYTLKKQQRKRCFILEKTISQEERIRRAEEIYNRRRMRNENGIRVSSSSVNNGKNKLSLFKKMALQLAICSVIYIIFYLIKNTNYIFSENVISKTKEMLSYDINFGNVYANVNTFIEDNKDKFHFTVVEDNNQENEEVKEESSNEEENNLENQVNNDEKNETEKQAENKVVNETNLEENEIKEGGIGGAETNEVQEVSDDEETQKTQMEIDAEYVKKNYSFKVPLEGTITSRYGEREATDIVSANHYGIDIGANTGTAIYAAMEGTVSLVSSEGDYRKAY